MSKKEKGNSSNVTIANFISVLGFVALAFLFFCGHSLQNPDENIGINIVVSVGATLLVAFILWLMVYAKEVENNFKRWLIVEILAAVAFVGAACWTGYEMMHFFVVNENMRSLKTSSEKDLDNIQEEIDSYVAKEGERLNVTLIGLRDAASANRYDSSVSDYISENKISDIDKWKELKSEEISDVEYERITYRKTWEREMEEIRAVTKNWNLFFLPDAVARITKLADNVSETLTSASSALNLSIIDARLNSVGEKYYTLGDSAPNEYDVKVYFPEKMKSISGFSILGILIILLVNALILFNYIFARRSRKVRPSSKTLTPTRGGVL